MSEAASETREQGSRWSKWQLKRNGLCRLDSKASVGTSMVHKKLNTIVRLLIAALVTLSGAFFAVVSFLLLWFDKDGAALCLIGCVLCFAWGAAIATNDRIVPPQLPSIIDSVRRRLL